MYLINYPVASPDEDGDLTVGSYDELVVFSLDGSNDPAADFNCDGRVNNRDLGLFQNHLGHKYSVTPIHERTWGSLKVLYR